MMRLMGENRDIMELEADLGVCILGGGHAGMCAAQTAEGLGAEVVVFDVNIQRLEYLRTVLKNTDLRFMSKTAFAEEVAKDPRYGSQHA